MARALRPLALVAGCALAALGVILAIDLVPVLREPWRTASLEAAAYHQHQARARLELELLAALGSSSADRAIAEATLDGLGGPVAQALPHLRRAAGRRSDRVLRLRLDAGSEVRLHGLGAHRVLRLDPAAGADHLPSAARPGERLHEFDGADRPASEGPAHMGGA